MEIESMSLSLDTLLLDPNNYRFLDNPDYRRVDSKRYHEESVQEHAREMLQGVKYEDLQALKDSILTNGYVPSEMLIVTQYASQKGLYVVVEGNRRTAAMRWVVEDYKAGVKIPKTLLDSYTDLPVALIDLKKASNRNAIQILMGIRHVAGIRAWEAYQQARLVVELLDDLKIPLPQVAQRLGMTTSEVNRRYRAYKALQQMERDEEYQQAASPRMYRLFHEAVSAPVVREWLGWSEKDFEFTNVEARQSFYSMLLPSESDDGDEQPAKLRTYSDVRELRKVIPHEAALRVLLDPNKSLADALAVAVAHEQKTDWLDYVLSATEALQKFSIVEAKNSRPTDSGV